MSALLHYFISTLVTIAYLVCVTNLGIFLFRLIGIDKIPAAKNGLLYVALSALLGLSILSNYWLLIGLHSLLSQWVIVCSLIVLALLSYPYRDVYGQAFHHIRSVFRLLSGQDFWIRWSLYLALSLLFLLGAASLIIMPWGDSEAFYMVWPKLISYLGAVTPQPNYFTFSQIGISGEMHFAVLMTLYSGHSASLLVWFVALFIITVFMGICTECRLNTEAKIICLVLIVSSSAFLAIIPFGNVNLFAAGYASAAIYLMVLTLTGLRDKKVQMITGLLLGLAMIAKLSYAVVLFPTVLLLLVLYVFKSSDNLYPGLKNGFVYGLIVLGMVLIAFVPHFYKNLILFNEPFAPFYFFQSAGEDGILDQVWFDSVVTRRIVLTYPFVLIFGNFPMQGGNISPLVLILLPLLVFHFERIRNLRIRENPALFLAVVSLISTVGWVALKPSVVAPRYILISMMLLFPFVGSLYTYIESNGVKRLAGISFVFVILFSFLHQPVPMFGKMIFNELKGNSQLNHRFYNASHHLNQTAAPGERVYLAGYYSYQLRADILSDLQNPGDYRQMGELFDDGGYTDYPDKLARLGFTYIFVQKESHSHVMPEITVQEEHAILFQDEHSVIVKIN